MRKRVVIKISGEELQGGAGKYNDEIIDKIITEITEIQGRGVQAALVVGGGNLWRGRDTRAGMDRPRSDQMGMLATMMNAIYLCDAFRAKGALAAVMTPFPAHTFAREFEKFEALRLMAEGRVLIFAGGTGLPFFSTDTIAAVRAAEIEADAILFAKTVNGIYDKDPAKFPDARKYNEITYDEIIQKNLKAIDIAAISVCRDQGIESAAFGLREKDSIVIAALGGDEELFEVGTRVRVN